MEYRAQTFRLTLTVLGIIAFIGLALPAQATGGPAQPTSCTALFGTNLYYATTNVPITGVTGGTPVTVTGCTTNQDVSKVVFTWTSPNGMTYTYTVTKPTTTLTITKDHMSYKVYEFTDTMTPATTGTWYVQVAFYTHKFTQGIGWWWDCCCISPKVVVKITSFVVTSEMPVVGTALAGGAMIGALALVARAGSRSKKVSQL